MSKLKLNPQRTLTVEYTEGYKYRLSSTVVFRTNIHPAAEVKCGGIVLTTDGILVILGGYSSDGPSGLTIDTRTFMFGAFVHDALYELLRSAEMDGKCIIVQPEHDRPGVVNGVYSGDIKPKITAATHEEIRQEADRILADICIEDGMLPFRVKYVYKAVRLGGVDSAKVKRKVFTAPKRISIFKLLNEEECSDE